jgi:hypothetical protein
MGARGKRQGNPWGCPGKGSPVVFPARVEDSMLLICRLRGADDSARRADAGRRGVARTLGRIVAARGVIGLCGICAGAGRVLAEPAGAAAYRVSARRVGKGRSRQGVAFARLARRRVYVAPPWAETPSAA